MSHPEELLISAVLRSDDIYTALNKGVTYKLFHGFQREWKWIQRYQDRYRRLPSRQAFKAKFPDFRIKAVNDVEFYSDEVRRAHGRYLISESIEEVLTHLEADEIEEAVKFLHGSVIRIQSEIEGDTGELDLVKDWSIVYDEVKKRFDTAGNTGLSGIPLGFPQLEQWTGGPQPGDLWIVAARLGMGKTWTCVRMGSAAFFAGYTVQFNALEQTAKQIGLRFHTFMSSQYGRKVFRSVDLMKGHGVDLLEYKRFLRKLPEQVKGRLLIADSMRRKITPLTIAAQIERNKPDAVFVDYLTLMDDGDRSWNDIAKLSRDLKLLAQRYEVPIIAAAQINRSGEGKEPPKAVHIALSDAIGQDADGIVTMSQISKRVMKMRLAKFRNGEDGGTWHCLFSPNTGQFEEISGDKATDIENEDRME